MKQPMYAINDSKRGSYSPPFCDSNDATAVRGFAEAVNNNPSFRYAPGDYGLYKIGVYDNEVGIIESMNPIEFICNGASVIGDKE